MPCVLFAMVAIWCYMVLTAEWISRTSQFARRSTASNVYICFYKSLSKVTSLLWVNVLNMSGICTAAPPHLDAHDKNSTYSYLYWSELGFKSPSCIEWYFCNFTHNNPQWSHYTKPKLHVKITHCQYFLRPPKISQITFSGEPMPY